MSEPKPSYRAARRRSKPTHRSPNGHPPQFIGPVCCMESCANPAQWMPVLAYQPAPMPGQPTAIFPARVLHPETKQFMIVCEACAQAPELSLRLTSDPQSYSAVFSLCVRQGLPVPDRRYTKLLFEPARFAQPQVDPE